MATHSQLLNTTSGRFDELFVRVPPDNEFADVADTVVAVAALQGETNGNSDLLAQQAQEIEGLKAKDQALQAEIDTKQGTLTANWPIRLYNDVLSFGFLAMEDAAAAAAERAAHLNQTNQNT